MVRPGWSALAGPDPCDSSRRRGAWRLLPALLILLVSSGAAAEPTAILLDDFEAGVGAWHTNDSTVSGTGLLARLCGIYATSIVPPGGGAQAAMIDFLPARDAWASVSLPVDGAAWRDGQVGQLSMWVRAAQGDATVVVALRARVPLPGGRFQDRSYAQELRLSHETWQRVSLRFFGFRTADGVPLDEQTVPHLYLLQFVKTGSWERMRFYVDRLEARPLLHGEQPSVELPETEETIVVDLRQQLGRCLSQVGFSITPDTVNPTDHPTRLREVSTLASGLRPCVGRLRLADYLDRSQQQFDLFRLDETIKWLIGIGIRPLVCLDMPDDRAGHADRTALDALVHSTSARLAELYRETATAPYYEIFDRPMQRRFAEIGELTAEYDRLASRLRTADPAAAIGGPGLAGVSHSVISEFVAAASPGFFSYHLVLQGPTWPDDSRLAHTAYTGAASVGHWGYEQTARYLSASVRGAELFITEWGVRRQQAADDAMRADQETAEALFLASSALSATRHVDKLMWSSLMDSSSGLLDMRGQPRPAYWAAWLINTYAPRGATCRVHMPRADNLLVTAVTTQTAANIFVVNRSPWPTTVNVQVVGMEPPRTVREHRLEPGQAPTVQHHNLSLSTIQKLNFQGAGMTVVQFIPPPAEP